MANKKVKKLDLNEYELIRKEEDFGDATGYVIIPLKQEDGTQPPPMLWKRRENKFLTITDTENAIWFKDIRISRTGTEADYAKRVDWWVENALNDDEWKDLINNMFNRYGFRIKDSMNKGITWLKTRTPSQRKSYLYKFFNNWFTTGLNMVIGRQQRG